ncbi:MAG TPA: hypothetical protein PJ998_06680 [Terrimesophilobacter sp.]|nr:hypothetical protein [Terrimesophilobacter sp.]
MTQARAQKGNVSICHEVGPAPDGGPLEIRMECRLSRASTRGAKHPVTIHADWNVTTPHDLDAERVAAAFGGYTSCLTLVENTIPAFRAMLPILSRHERVSLTRSKNGRWQLPPAMQISNCCRGHEFITITAAAHHVRTAGHISLAYDAPRWQVSSLMSSAQNVWGSWERDPSVDVQCERRIREPEGATELWRAGLRPDELADLAAHASAVHEPLPVSYFLGMAYGNADPNWIGEVLIHRPDADTAAWLAWLDSPEMTASACEWGAWLQFGLPKNDVRIAVEAGLRADRVLMIASETGWPSRVAARNLVAWAKVGCFPTIEQFKTIVHHGVEHLEPSGSAIDSLTGEVQLLGTFSELAHDRTTLGVLLMIFGTRRGVLNALKSSILGADVFANQADTSNEWRVNHEWAGKIA